MKKQICLLMSFFGLGLMMLNPCTSDAQGHWWQDWTKNFFNPVLQSSDDTWFYYAFPSTVIYENDTYKMWFSGWDGENSTRRVGIAISNDGINWDISPTHVLQGAGWDEHIYIGSVLRVNDTLRMWYTGFPQSLPVTMEIGYAWSLDGYDWHRHPDPVLTLGDPGTWDDDLIEDPEVIYNGETYHMYYDNLSGIGHATSPNGIDWTKDEEHNPIHFIQPNTFYSKYLFTGGTLLYNDTIHMWFTGRDVTNHADRIGYGYSTDYSTFTWYEADTALDRGPMVWDAADVDVPDVLVVNGNYKMWYIGDAVSTHFKIGAAAGPAVPCVPVYFNGCEHGDGFEDFILEGIQNTGSGCANSNGTGWTNYHNMVAQLMPGETYVLTIKSNSDMQYATVWADWNQDGEYGPDEIVIDNFIMEEAGVSYDVDFYVPESRHYGVTYLRARTNRNDSCNDPCANYYYGETEEYKVDIFTGIEESAVSGQQSAVNVYPNPADEIFNFQFSTFSHQRVTLKIYDLNGREMAIVLDKMLPEGEHTVSFNASFLAPGIYIWQKLEDSSQFLASGKLIKF